MKHKGIILAGIGGLLALRTLIKHKDALSNKISDINSNSDGFFDYFVGYFALSGLFGEKCISDISMDMSDVGDSVSEGFSDIGNSFDSGGFSSDSNGSF